MNYSAITEDLSHLVRDASLELSEDRHLQIMLDPGQRWTNRGRPLGSDEDLLEPEIIAISDLC